MCLIFLSLNSHPVYKLIVAANRDEFYQRKTAPAEYWDDYSTILGGRDLEANGTWLGMTRTGKISLLTNYRDPKNINPKAPSRGQLVSDYLASQMDPAEYLNKVAALAKQYNGFNLVAGNIDSLYYMSNYATGVHPIDDGIHGLSNALLDTPWPKVTRGKQRFEALLEGPFTTQQLFEFLYDDHRAADVDLPNTGIGLERERALSSMFIKTDNYGSRCSTVVLVDHQNRVTFSERVYDTSDFTFSLRTFEFSVGHSA
jgi:uncharacterized protein with NRDE domain